MLPAEAAHGRRHAVRELEGDQARSLSGESARIAHVRRRRVTPQQLDGTAPLEEPDGSGALSEGRTELLPILDGRGAPQVARLASHEVAVGGIELLQPRRLSGDCGSIQLEELADQDDQRRELPNDVM